MSKLFYRVCHLETKQGLWYDQTGEFTGLIHKEFDFCKHKNLQMAFEPELVGWLSATETLGDLLEWFPIQDIKKLQEHHYYLHEYLAKDVNFYEKFQHLIIKQDTSIVNKIIIV